jgi:DNA-binding CsgD family transcriptional regulator
MDQSSSIHQELQTLLLADAGPALQEHLLGACRARSVAGVSCFRLADKGAGVEVLLAEDFSGEMDGVCLHTLTREAFAKSPAWIRRWAFSRRKPVHLRRVFRFIPFSGQLMLRASAPPGRRPLKDFILVPHRQNEQTLGLLIALLEPVDYPRAEELSSLGSAFLARLSDAPLARQVPDLSERQLQCLRWIVAGKSLQETAVITGMSYANVRYHLERAKKAAGLASLQQLIAYAAVHHNLSPFGPVTEAPTEASADSAPVQSA